MTELDRWLDRVHCGDCLDVLRELPDCSVDLCATDPPYALTSGTGAKGGFMGKAWDAALPARAIWAEVLRVLKPGASCFVCAGARQDTLLGMLTDLREVGFDIQHAALSWVYWCVSADTEALTDKGWRAYSELQVGDSLCTMNVQTGKLEYQPCQAVNAKHYSGPMVRIRGRATDQLLTPNHRVVVKWRRHSGCRYWTDENWSVVEAKDITPHAGVSFPIAAELDGSLDMDPDFAALLGWVITEGHYQSDCGAVNIYQSSTNEKHVQTIRQLLRDLGIQHSEYQGERTYKGKPYVAYQWYINGEWAERIKRWLPDKKPCRELLMLNRSALERMIEACIDGDGCRGDHEVSFYQKDPEILDWFRIACLHLGIGTSRPNSKDGVNLRSPNYQLQTRHIQGSNVAPEQYDGVVWCPSTPNGTFVARRNGYIFITGNSGFPKSTDVGKDIDKAAFLAWVKAQPLTVLSKCPWEHKHEEFRQREPSVECPECRRRVWALQSGYSNEITRADIAKAASAAVNGAYSTHEVSEGRQRQCKHGPNEVTRPWEVESGSGTGTRLLAALQARFGDAPGVRQKVGEYMAPRQVERGTFRSEWTESIGGDSTGAFCASDGLAKHSTSPATPEAVQWDGWHSGSCPLKPMTEHILWVTKPAESGPARGNVLKWGVGL
ncbi:MAG: LAGLIDADG family homing endonuclease, partial [Anaerovoracaceae bacterium]